MKGMRSLVVAAPVGLVVITGGLPAAGASDAEQASELHCVVEAVAVSKEGAIATEDRGCFPTLDEALAAAGVAGSEREPRSSVSVSRPSVAATRVIGTHFDGLNRTGSSISIVGTDCSGGHVNLSAAWTDRISSTQNGCATVRFFDGFDKTGAWEDTAFNLSALNNQANSIMYGS